MKRIAALLLLMSSSAGAFCQANRSTSATMPASTPSFYSGGSSNDSHNYSSTPVHTQAAVNNQTGATSRSFNNPPGPMIPTGPRINPTTRKNTAVYGEEYYARTEIRRIPDPEPCFVKCETITTYRDAWVCPKCGYTLNYYPDRTNGKCPYDGTEMILEVIPEKLR